MKRLLISLLTLAVLATPVYAVAAGRNVLTDARIRQVITDYLQEKTAHLGVEIRLKSVSPGGGDIPLPPGNVSCEVVAPQEWEGWGRGSLALIVRVDDKVVKNIPLNVTVEALADLVVTTHPLEPGGVVGKADVALQKRDISGVPGRVCRRLDEALGKRVRMAVRGNSPLRSDLLEMPPLIKSGQLVTIIAENDAFRVTATGKAKGSGAAGDVVLVQNLNTHKDLSAMVVDSNTVRVEF
jgi:flagellar basal body P-ring formation protein FlgA